MNPRLKNGRTGEVERKYNRGYAEPATAEQVKSRLLAPDVKEDTRLIREEGREDLKDTGLFTLCPHYSAFKDNHRCQACILPEAFTFRTCVDVDEKELVQKAIEKALEVNRDEMSDWKDMVEYIEYSPRKKCHIWLLMPVGKTIEETQKAFCEDINIPYDTSCITPERYINMTGDVVLMSNHWLQPLTDEELEERREAFLKRGLDVDGRPLKKPETVKKSPAVKSEIEAYVAEPVTATARTLYIFDRCLKEAGLELRDLTEEGGRHNALKSVLSVGACQLLKRDELNGVLQMRMPDYWQSDDIQRLLTDFYDKYTDDSQKMTQFQRRVFAQSLRMSKAEKVSTTAETPVDNVPVYGDITTLSVIYASPFPPRLPRRLPALVKHVTSKTPMEMKDNVAQGMFPPLGVYPRNLKFEYIDNQYRELRSNCLTIGGTGSGKDTSLKQPLKHLTAPMEERDRENRKRLEEFKEQYKSKASNKEKPKRPTDLIIQYVSANLTPARLAQLMEDSQGAFAYASLHEFEQWYGVEGKSANNCTFLNLKLADDEDNPFGQERAGAESVNYRGPLGLNWNASTTPSRAQQMLRSVLVDGPLSRLCLATTPDRGLGAPIPVYGRYDESYDKALRPYIDNLRNATGEVVCKQAKKLIEKLKAECDNFTQQTQDEVFDNLTHRALVHTFRKACLLYAANGMKWEKSIEGFCRWSLHYDLWLKLHFFGDLIRNADGQTQTSHRGPRNLLELLPEEFTRQDAANIRQQMGKDIEKTGNMLSQWVHRKYILQMTDDRFKKVV